MKKYGIRTEAGKTYERGADGQLREHAPARPDVVICRRVVDFPNGCPPAGAGVTNCDICQSPIAFNPAGPHGDRPKICTQCASIEPLPL